MLFEVKKIKENLQPVETPGSVVRCNDHVAATSMKLQDVVAKVDHGKTVQWVSNGDWSMHQLLYKLLELTGPADVYISSYAFSELPARTIADLKQTRIIGKLFCVIDSRIDVRSASALAIVRNTADHLKLINTHAKITLIKTKEWQISVVCSANYTTNKRYETGMICTDAETFFLHQQWILKELQNDV